MSDYQESIGACGLHCFGSISASVSHELKNALAIINENAGLLEDLSFMAEKGLPLDPAKLKSLAANIGKQIQRADGIIRNMNRFAHSTDETVKCIDLGETMALIVTLSSRLAAMKCVTLIFKPPPQTICVTTHLFYLENLIWLYIKEILERTGTEKEITLTLRSQQESAAVIFSPVDVPVTDGRAIDLLSYLKATQSANSQHRELLIILPVDMTAC